MLARGSIALALSFAVAPAEAQEWVEDRTEVAARGPGSSVSIGAGVFGFLDDRTASLTDAGGEWTVRVAVGTRWRATLELAYVGSANGVSALGLDERAILLGNGIEGVVRWNVLSLLGAVGGLDLGFARFNPYLHGGIGWRNYLLANDDFNTSSLHGSDDVGEVPLGGGVAFYLSPIVIDLRAEFRAAFDDDLVSGGAGLSTWNAGARIGWEL